MKRILLKPDLLFKILLYLSIPFIIYYLIRFDFISLKNLHFNYSLLILSIVLLWTGFVFSAFSWRYALLLHKIRISYRMAIVSHGLSIFAKYIPGKIWVILGRASFISGEKNKLKDTSFISLKEQLLYILLGLIISFIPSIGYFGLNKLTITLILFITGLALILFNNYFHDLAEKLINKIIKKNFSFPKLGLFTSVQLSLYILMYWLLWTSAFYFLVKSLYPDVALISAFAFPLSVCYGVLALFMPGGIGVRESIMVTFLVAIKVDLQSAITISICSRLWYMTGELFFFLLALTQKKKLH